MKLSSLISYKSLLEDMIPLDTVPLAHDKLAPVLYTVQSNEIQFTHLTEQLESNYQEILKKLDNFDQTADQIKSQIELLIRQHESGYYENSTELYRQMMQYDSNEYVLNRQQHLTPEIKELIVARLQLQGNWRHAGMIIRPGREDWINFLVGCDPLYLVDTHQELLDPALLRFNEHYQRRLRIYTVTESVQDPILKQLPSGQFAFCLIYNFFNFKPLEIVNAYLSELFQKLKPGGTIALTINDCDRPGAVNLAESGFKCYTPKQAILDHCQSLGFELVQSFHIDAASTWLEFKRPGELTSLRGGQALAQIFSRI
jgi:SAM-dependent methyltransferase